MTSENFRVFGWTKASIQAAADIADGRLDQPTIARKAGITARQLRNWTHHPDFAARVARVHATFAARVEHLTVASKAARMEVYDDLLARNLRVITAREEAAAKKQTAGYDKPMAGEESGLIAVKQIGIGREAIREAAFDSALVASALKICEQAAKENGDWVDRKQVDASLTLRDVAEKIAARDGLDPAAVVAEAEAVLRELAES